MISCAACGGDVEPPKIDWCSVRCRAALRRFGSALLPTGTRAEQMATALDRRRTLAELDVKLSGAFWRRT